MTSQSLSATDGVLYCTVHPDRETSLRCNKCGRPMCTQCAVLTPVGYRCRECVREQQGVFYNAASADYLIAAVVSLVLGAIAGIIVSAIGFFFLSFFISPVAGALIGDIVHRAVRRRRGRYTWLVVGAGVVLGALLPRLLPMAGLLLAALAAGAPVPLAYVAAPLVNPSLWIFLVLGTGAAIGRLRFGRVRFGI